MKIQQIQINNISEQTINPRGLITHGSVLELSENISQYGLLNPIQLRKLKGDKYDVIAGRRRLLAYKLLKLKVIDAIVIDADDVTAYEISIIENLQREDIHPLKEAEAMKILLKTKSIEDLPAILNKSAAYVSRNLKLNDLNDDIKKKFLEDKLSLDHCLELCRLSPADQKKAFSFISFDDPNNWENKIKAFRPVEHLRSYIDINIVNSLDKVAFSKEDPKLYESAGSCLLCPKRSGNNKSLFNDIKNDCCFDANCYQIKLKLHCIKLFDKLIGEGYKVKFLSGSYSLNGSEINKIGKGIADIDTKKILFNSDYKVLKKESPESLKGIWIDGSNPGTVVNFEIYKQSSMSMQSEEKAAMTIPQTIEKTKQRLERAIELDRAKIYPLLHQNILNKIDHYDVKSISKKQPELIKEERRLFILGLYERSNMDFQTFMDKTFFKGIDMSQYARKDDKAKMFKLIDGITDQQFRQITRAFIKFTFFETNAMRLERDIFLYDSLLSITDHYDHSKTAQLLAEQSEIRAKRESRAEEKIKVLKSQKGK